MDPMDDHHLPGDTMSLAWALPFASLLGCISIIPVVFPEFWHHYMGWVTLAHVVAMLIPMIAVFKFEVMLESVLESMLHEYIPFMARLFALFVVCGGIRITDKIRLRGRPLDNFAVLFLGVMLSSWMGTTGASVLLVRPLLRSNLWRKQNAHVFVFFIFLVSNLGGALSPLGDPPLFLGFLKGISFGWFTVNLAGPWAVACGLELVIFVCIDTFLYRKEGVGKDELEADGVGYVSVAFTASAALSNAPADSQAGESGPGSAGGSAFQSKKESIGGGASQSKKEDSVTISVGGDASQSKKEDPARALLDSAGDGGGNALPAAQAGSSGGGGGGARGINFNSRVSDESVQRRQELLQALEGKHNMGTWDIFDGWRNIPLLIMIPVTVLLTGVIEVDHNVDIVIYHVHLELEDIIRDIILYAVGITSILITDKSTRELNGFNWFPIKEIGTLFFGIFLTMIPIVAILEAGNAGALKFIIDLVEDNGNPNNPMYYILTGILSSLLDNAPTFLVFFNTAGANVPDKSKVAEVLMNEKTQTLLAISIGAVFMGALTYIGNAPNFIVKSICENQGVKMPNFGMYIVWSVVCLGPVLSIVGAIFLREESPL